MYKNYVLHVQSCYCFAYLKLSLFEVHVAVFVVFVKAP